MSDAILALVGVLGMILIVVAIGTAWAIARSARTWARTAAIVRELGLAPVPGSSPRFWAGEVEGRATAIAYLAEDNGYVLRIAAAVAADVPGATPRAKVAARLGGAALPDAAFVVIRDRPGLDADADAVRAVIRALA